MSRALYLSRFVNASIYFTYIISLLEKFSLKMKKVEAFRSLDMVAKDSSEIEIRETIVKYILHFNRFASRNNKGKESHSG